MTSTIVELRLQARSYVAVVLAAVDGRRSRTLRRGGVD